MVPLRLVGGGSLRSNTKHTPHFWPKAYLAPEAMILCNQMMSGADRSSCSLKKHNRGRRYAKGSLVQVGHLVRTVFRIWKWDDALRLMFGAHRKAAITQSHTHTHPLEIVRVNGGVKFFKKTTVCGFLGKRRKRIPSQRLIFSSFCVLWGQT